MTEAKKLLIHVCCAPCLVAPYYDMISRGMDITAFWYNPNIHPFTEYQQRLRSLQDFIHRESIPLILKDEYDLDLFLQKTVSLGKDRCASCYEIRLEQSAICAAENGFDAFSSTLLYSRYQNHELMCNVAQRMADKYHIEFYYQDFRNFWQQGIQLSKEQEMYRQKYCGCIYSERDRYLKKRG